MTVRAPQHHMDLYRSRARAVGMNVGDYLAMILAESHDLDVPDYIQDKKQLKFPVGA